MYAFIQVYYKNDFWPHNNDKNSPFGSKKWPHWPIKAQNDPKIRAELNSLKTGNTLKGKLFV